MNIKRKLQILMLVTACAMGGVLAVTALAFNSIDESAAAPVFLDTELG